MTQEAAYPELFDAFAGILGDPSAHVASELLPVFEDVAAKAPEMAAPHLGRALCQFYLGARDEALTSLDRALEMGFGAEDETTIYIEIEDPDAEDEVLEFELDLGSTLFLRADMLLALGRPRETLDQLEDVQDAGISGIYAADVHAARAIALVQLDEVDAAEDALSEAEDWDEGSERVLEARGRIAMAQDRHDAAVGVFSDAIAVAPDDKEYLLLRARALIAAKRVDEARSDLKAALQLVEAAPVPDTEAQEITDLLSSL
jgi:tetratricopeptide (TPR) repeat protein